MLYNIDPDNFTIRDMITIQKLAKNGNNMDLESILPILDRCVILEGGGSVEELPAAHFKIIMQKLMERFAGNDLSN
jgi:hypothetical protein